MSCSCWLCKLDCHYCSQMLFGGGGGGGGIMLECIHCVVCVPSNAKLEKRIRLNICSRFHVLKLLSCSKLHKVDWFFFFLSFRMFCWWGGCRRLFMLFSIWIVNIRDENLQYFPAFPYFFRRLSVFFWGFRIFSLF